MDESNILNRAANPEQYDSGDLSWEAEGGVDSTRTFFFREYLSKYYSNWKEKDLLDIGAGNGWLIRDALNAGAHTVVGVEPSSQNFLAAKKINPAAQIVQSSFEDYNSKGQTFDAAAAVMSFSHINDLGKAFSKVNSLLKTNGELIIVVPDYDYFKLPRHDYKIETQELNKDEYVISITRPSGTIADIVRKNSVYTGAASQAGFKLTEQIPMFPTEAYIARAPKFVSHKDKSLTQLLKFQK